MKAYQCLQDILQPSQKIINQNGHCNSTTNCITLQLGHTTPPKGDIFYLPQKEEEDSLITFLQLIGWLHQNNFTPNCSKLYPKIKFPVSRGTPAISPLIRWDHQDDWFVISYRNSGKLDCYEKTVGINVKENEWNYITGHIIDGKYFN